MTGTVTIGLAPLDIHLNADCPDNVRTAMLPDDRPEVKLTETLYPVGQISGSGDPVGGTQLLARDAAAYVTGQAISKRLT